MKIDKTSDCDECYQVALTIRLGCNTKSGATKICMQCLQAALKLIEPLHDDDVIVCPDCDGTKRVRIFSEDKEARDERPCRCCMATGQMTRKEARELKLVPSVLED